MSTATLAPTTVESVRDDTPTPVSTVTPLPENDQTPPDVVFVSGQFDQTAKEVRVIVVAADESGIDKVVVSYIEDPSQGSSNIRSLDLIFNASTQKWVGVFPGSLESRFFIQAVDKAGNMTTETKKGSYYAPWESSPTPSSTIPPTPILTPTVMPTATTIPKRDRLAIILAGRNEEDDPLQPNIEHITQRAFDLFSSHGYYDEDIYYLTTDESATGFDDLATNNNLQFAIEDWAAARLNENGMLTLYIMDHGEENVIYIDGMNGEQLTPTDLDQWLTTLEENVTSPMINVFIEACRSGSFLLGPNGISKEGRVIITSSDADADAHASQNGAYFSDAFITSLYSQNLYESYYEAKYSFENIFWLQQPLLDSNGNGTPKELEDKEIASQRYLGERCSLTDTRPEIIKDQAELIVSGRRGQVRVRVEDDGTVQKVWAVVYPPSYKPPTGDSGQLVNGDPDGVILLEHQDNNVYIGSEIDFEELGTYKIVVQATDNENMTAMPLILEVGSELYLPFIKR